MKIIKSNGSETLSLLDSLRDKTLNNELSVETTVRGILEDVKTRGDEAVKEYSLKFDGTNEIKEYSVSDFQDAFNSLDSEFKEVLIKASNRISTFHNAQLVNGIKIKDDGIELGQIIRPLERVGLYVPGGTAAYPSSVLMNAIPAKIAGVKEIVIITPPLKNGINKDVLAAAYLAGVDSLFTIGGAQGIAALAYGTKTIKKVDKIVGPGNIYVATAKKLVFGICDIDMVAGPSEITIIADEQANAKFIAADLISQAEHDILAQAILITTSADIAKLVVEELDLQTSKLSRNSIIKKSLDKFGLIIVCDNLNNATETANYIAPEHLELLTKDPFSLLEKINNAGSIFIGEYTPEPIGDYIAGTNHVLPTSGSSRFFSPLSVDSFMKKMQYISYCKRRFIEDASSVIVFAEREGLTGHASAIRVRLE